MSPLFSPGQSLAQTLLILSGLRSLNEPRLFGMPDSVSFGSNKRVLKSICFHPRHPMSKSINSETSIKHPNCMPGTKIAMTGAWII